MNKPAALIEDKLRFLTSREQDVLSLLASGCLYREIGGQLDIGVETVRTHVKKICKKMQARNRLEAVAKYCEVANHGRQLAPDTLS